MFARRGYEQAGVDEIAAEAGYSKGALYWHFSGKEELLTALLEAHRRARARDGRAPAVRPSDRDMSVEAASAFARRLREQREAVLLDREYWSLAIRDPALRARYIARQTDLRRALAAALEARMRHLGTPDLPMGAEQVARVVMTIIGGFAVDELIEPRVGRPGSPRRDARRPLLGPLGPCPAELNGAQFAAARFVSAVYRISRPATRDLRAHAGAAVGHPTAARAPPRA